MLRKVLFFSLAITVTAVGLGVIFPDHRVSGHNQIVPESRAGDEVLLDSTVLMTMYGQRRLVDANAGVYEIKTAMGLGTLIMIEGHVLILTHDHWGPLDDDLQRVEYRDGTGSLLASTPGSEFIDGIRYRDGGTIVVKAPARLISKLSPAPMGTISNGTIGLPVQIVRRAPASSTAAQVMEAEVVAIETKKGKQVLVLRSKSGDAVVPGDSGGGIYYEGKLVGNLWTAITEEVTVTQKGLFGSTTKVDSISDKSRAALLTREMQSLIPDAPGSVPPETTQTGSEF